MTSQIDSPTRPAASRSLLLPPEPGDAAVASAQLDAGIPAMGDESTYAPVEGETPPVRPSGFVGLILGIISFAATAGLQALLIPLAAIAVCLFALRKSGDVRPVGTTAAKIGLILACGFGACGAGLIYFKYQTIGGQAEHFAREFLELCRTDNKPLIAELQRSAINRRPAETRLDETPEATGEPEPSSEEAAMMASEAAEEGGLADQIRELPRDPQWKLVDKDVFIRYRVEKVELRFKDTTGQMSSDVTVEMIWDGDKDGIGQWHVGLFQFHRERIVAESIL